MGAIDKRRSAQWALPVCVVLVIGACSGEHRDEPPTEGTSNMGAMARYVDGSDSLPRIQYANGLVTLNDRCMVRQKKLSLRLPPVYVNGEPVGFC